MIYITYGLGEKNSDNVISNFLFEKISYKNSLKLSFLKFFLTFENIFR